MDVPAPDLAEGAQVHGRLGRPVTGTPPSGQITSRELARLVGLVQDAALRGQIEDAMAKLELHRLYGLRFERHLPEVIDHKGKTLDLRSRYYPFLRFEDRVEGDAPKGPEHVLIECDNHVGLKYLQYTHEEKIDVIYIDPPYNTGARDWKYNNRFVDEKDSFRHSKWLSFMEKRLRLAKTLLRPEGVLICAIDHHELFPLGMLVEDIFGGWVVTQTVVVNNKSGRATDPFAICHEYHLVVHKPGRKANPVAKTDQDFRRAFPLQDGDGRYRERPLRRCNDTSGNRDQRPNQFYPIWVDESQMQVKSIGDPLPRQAIKPKPNGHLIPVLPINRRGKEKVWSYTPQSLRSRLAAREIELVVKRTDGGIQIYYKERAKPSERPKTVWVGDEHNYSSNGTEALKELLPKAIFNFPKSVKTVQFAVDRFLPKEGICLDFFAGSGTTFQAIAELNEADQGNRQCILITNNEGNICREVTWERVKRVTRGTAGLPGISKPYPGSPSAQASFYSIGVHEEDSIYAETRGWKKDLKAYLPLLSTKLSLPHAWRAIPNTKGFYQEGCAIILAAEADADAQAFLKKEGITVVFIVADDRVEFDLVSARLKKTTRARNFYLLPRHYTDYFHNFHAK